ILLQLCLRHRDTLLNPGKVRLHEQLFSLKSFAQAEQRIGKVGQRPVKVWASRLLDHFLERIYGQIGNANPHYVADQCWVFSQMTSESKQCFGGTDRVVEAPARNLSAESNLQS